VPYDFERVELADALRGAGFREDQAACFSWLGVTPYLTEGAFDHTMEFVAGLPAGSRIVLDYAVPRSILNEKQKMALDKLSVRVADVGEPLQLFFLPEELRAKLLGMGFREVEDLGKDELNARYFEGREDKLRVRANLARMVCARV
jgi:O-methyltransferase involved in polyketide biosynthesis